MARTTSIDVPRLDLVIRLKEIVVEIPKALKEYDAAQKAHKQAMKDWATNLVNDPANFKEVMNDHYRGGDAVIVHLTAKAAKTKPKYDGPSMPRVSAYNESDAIEQLQSTINILEMSKSEFVGVSILNKISQYL